MTVGEFDDGCDIIKAIKKDRAAKKYIGKTDLYFDGSDLVFDTTTIFSELVSDYGYNNDVTINDIIKKILSTDISE